jgi:hypothetical protein
MASNHDLSAYPPFIDVLFKRAHDHFNRKDEEEAKRLCRRLLSYPHLSDYHKAGCHHILGRSYGFGLDDDDDDDSFVYNFPNTMH